MKHNAKVKIRTLLIILTLIAQMFVSPQIAKAEGPSTTPLAEGDVIYQVLVDRFSNGDSTNDNLGLSD